MAKTRRVIRQAPPAARPYFDEQQWPVAIALVVLGGFLMGLSLAYQPLSGVPWHRTAWPSLIAIPLIAVAAWFALLRINSHAFRRSLQLSLVLCAIFHVALVVQMMETRMLAGLHPVKVERVQREIIEQRPRKVVPEYHPTLLIPDADRPRQDFQKPVETQSPEPTREPEKIIRQPAEQDRSPQPPQPIPILEQQRTSEPNVVNRTRPSESAPRLASQTSQLSRQVKPSEAKTSRPVELPAGPLAAAQPAQPEPTPSSAARQDITRQSTEQQSSAAARPQASEPTAASQVVAASPVRQSSTPAPTNSASQSATQPERTVAAARSAAKTAATPPPAATSSKQSTPKLAAAPAPTPAQRTAAATSNAQPPSTPPPPEPAANQTKPAANLARAAAPANATPTIPPQASSAEVPHRALAAAPEASSPVNIDSPAPAVAQNAEAAAQPRRMAVSRAQGGIAGAGRSPNVESSLPGGESPALVASGALQRAEATQRNPTGSALSPSASSQLARTRSEAEIATAPLLARTLDTAGTAGAKQLAEVTASSGASLVRSQSAATSAALNAAKGTAQIDLGPTQRVAEAGVSRAASGGGQAELSLQTPSPQLARQRLAAGEPQMALATPVAGEVAAPEGTGGGSPQASTPHPLALASQRNAGTGTSAADRPSSTSPSAAADPGAGIAAAAPSRSPVATSASESSTAADSATGRLTRTPSPDTTSAIAGVTDRIALPASTPTATTDGSAAPSSSSSLARQSTDNGSKERATGTTSIDHTADKRAAGSIASKAPARRDPSPDSIPGEQSATGSPAGDAAAAPSRRPADATPSPASTAVAAIPEVGPGSSVAQAEADHLLSGGGQAPMARQSDDSLVVEVPAAAGPGGLGIDYTPEVGINTRQARADSLNVQLRSARFVRTQLGGIPAVSTSAIVSSEAFSSRGARVLGNSPAGGRGSEEPQTEEAIERGLAFLARYQLPDGGWSLQGFPEGAQLVSDTAATALAVLAFQGAGYHHREFQYKDVVRGGLDALIKAQKENGDLFVPLDDASNRSVWLYSHSLAAIALCEAYGMTQDPALREPAQKAVNFVVSAQQKERGGWRYSPGVGADTSVSGWMMMALKSGELAGLQVPRETYARIDRWLSDAQQSPTEPHLYRYNPFAPETSEQRHGRAASKTMTAVGLLMRLYTGWKRDNPNMIRGADFLSDNLPDIGTTRAPERDTYYWYYATQVMAHMGADYWQAWIARLHPLLIDAQVRQGAYAGSWDPVDPVPDRWGPHAGRLYVTALNLLSLEVQYRKLPLYDDAIR